MFRVMVKQNFEFDTFHGEYSGLKHETREAAEKELKEAEKFKILFYHDSKHL